MNNKLEAALKYRDQGFSVIPVKSDKKPYLSWEKFQHKKADEKLIKEWWETWPDANVGIVTGEISRLCVVDVDSSAGMQEFESLIPDTLVTPVVQTPRGKHYYFKNSNRVGNAVGFIKDCDFRGEGGYIVAPPSQNGKGGYSWLPGLSIEQVTPAELPKDVYKNLNNKLYIYRGVDTFVDTAKNKPIIFTQGNRDNALFHLANYLVKGGMPVDNISNYLHFFALHCDPPFPANEIQAKISSALSRSEGRAKALSDEVREWVLSTDGHFLSTDVHNSLQVSTRKDKKNVSEILKRLLNEGLIERYGTKNGSFRRIDTEIEYMDFANADISNTVNLELPLDLHRKTSIYPKAVVVIAGVTGMGKTLYALNAIAENMGKFPIYYFNSEMGPEALKKKISHFPVSINEWQKNMRVVDNWDFFNIQDKIQPDAFNVIDYLEPDGEKTYNIHAVISAIIKRLKQGTALITIQKKQDTKVGVGGIYSIKAATISCALDFGTMEITKNRFREDDAFPYRDKINFHVENGYKLIAKDGWVK